MLQPQRQELFRSCTHGGAAQLGPDSSFQEHTPHPLATGQQALAFRVRSTSRLGQESQPVVNPLELHLERSRAAHGRIAIQPGNEHAQPFQIGPQTLHRQSAAQRVERMVGQEIAERDPRLRQPFLHPPGKDLAVANAELAIIENRTHGLPQFRQAPQDGPPATLGRGIRRPMIQGTPQPDARVDMSEQPCQELALAPLSRLD